MDSLCRKRRNITPLKRVIFPIACTLVMLEVADLNTAECFLSFRLAEETFLASPPSRRCHTEGTVGHLQARPVCPRRLRSAADMLAFISPSSGL